MATSTSSDSTAGGLPEPDGLEQILQAVQDRTTEQAPEPDWKCPDDDSLDTDGLDDPEQATVQSIQHIRPELTTDTIPEPGP